MKVCSHIIRKGLSNIPAVGGDYCVYCVQEDITKNSFESKYACKKADCPSALENQPHWHSDEAESIGTPA